MPRSDILDNDHLEALYECFTETIHDHATELVNTGQGYIPIEEYGTTKGVYYFDDSIVQEVFNDFMLRFMQQTENRNAQ